MGKWRQKSPKGLALPVFFLYSAPTNVKDFTKSYDLEF